MATMKKQAKATAVKKGTYYECAWCGKEGTNTPYSSTTNKVVCGRAVEQGKKYYCSAKCQHISCVEHNRRRVIEAIDFTNTALGMVKNGVAEHIKDGDKINPVILQMAKMLNIFKKVLTFLVSGDTPSARKLYDEKKAIVTDCAEDVLADKEWADLYMFFINRFAEVDGMLTDRCSF
jgi:predicted nucleic acid-binding Zn ribbon protein